MRSELRLLKYWVLEPRSSKADNPYARASRAAMLEYARSIHEHNPQLAEDLERWALREERAAQKAHGIRTAGG